MIRQAVILCGGKGERLGYATDEIPKPLVEVGGKPFVTYAISMLEGIGFENIVLLCKDFAEEFRRALRGMPFSGDIVKVMGAEGINTMMAPPYFCREEMLRVPNLQELFLLLNGDSFPLMDWRAFVDTDKPRVAVKIIGRDAGAAVVRKADIHGHINCLDIKGMMGKYENYIVLGGLHIGTPQGLQRARTFIDIAVYGQ